MLQRFWKSSSFAILALAGPAAYSGAYAQNPPATGAGAASAQLEEIVVTARRTEEKLQRTPVAVTAITSQMLDRLNIQQPSQLSQVIPNFVLSQGSGGPTNIAISIRGIGNQEPLLTVDAPVGVYLDGVYLGRDAAINTDLVDLARVEVLRGPQGTLFGRNTSGGAVNMVTKDPSDTFTLQEKAGWGEHDGWYTKTSVNTGELGDSGIKATIAYLHRDRGGFVDNPYAAPDDAPSSLHSNAVWAKIRGDFGDLRIDYSFDYDSIDGQNEGFQIIAMSPAWKAYFGQSPLFGGDPLVLQGTRRDPLPLFRSDNLAPTMHAVTLGHAVTATYDVNDEITLKSITAYRHWYASEPTRYGAHFKGPVLDPVTFAFAGIQDVSPFYAPLDVAQYQYSEEIQLLAKTDRWNSVGGLYYFYEHVKEDNPNYFTFVTPTGNPALPYVGLNLSSAQRYRENSASYAAFGQTSYRPPILDDKLEVTAGLRYTIDHRSINLFDLGATPRNGIHNYYDFNFNFSTNYQWSDEVMTYIRISTGYKAGGFNARQTSPTASLNFQPEKATAYEIGVKSEWLDHKLRANATAFYTDYQNLQVNQYTGGIGTTTNANAYYEGFELEAQALPVKELSLEGSVGYVNPVYTYYPYSNPATLATQNYAYIAHFPYVPDWTIHLGVQYYFPETSLGAPSLRVDYSMTSERYWFGTNLSNANPFNNVIKDPGQNLLSARFIMSDIPVFDGKAMMEIQVYGTNLLDQDLRDSGIDFGGLNFAGVSFGEPRSIGFDVNLKY